MQRYFSKKLIDNHFILADDDLYHINTVMRMRNGDSIEVVYDNELYLGELNIENKIIKIKMINKINYNTDIKSKVTLIVPLLKEHKMDYILQKSTELGVDTIIPVSLSRCIVKVDNNKEEKKLERWGKICKEASEQSKRLDIPYISKIMNIKDIIKLPGCKLICSTINKDNIISNILPNIINKDITFIFGPEGGFSENEESLLISNDYIPITFGSSILRSETAPLYMLSIINYEANKNA